MAFSNYSPTQTEGRKSIVDYDALNKYVVDTCGLESPEVLIGVVSGIIDLGIQNREDAEIVYTGTEADEAAVIADKPSTYFKDGLDPDTRKPCRLMCYPQKAIQSVAVAVDFPEIMLDKGKFFGNESGEAKPLRMFLGGEFYNPTTKTKVVARPTPLKYGKDSKGRWSFNNKHLFYKMAVASKLILPDGVFMPENIDQLVGKAFQFEAQVFMKPSKDKKQYYTEKVAFKSGLGRGQEAPELTTDTFVVQFNEANEDKALKELRFHIVNTIKNAVNYEGSPIQKQLEAARNYTKVADTPADDTPDAPEPEVKKTTRTPRVVKPQVPEDNSDDVPF